MSEYRLIEDEFKFKGVNFKLIKRGKNALMFKAVSDFYSCESIEVWKIRISKDRVINGVSITGGEIKPSNDLYPVYAHQYMRSAFKSNDDYVNSANNKFNYYENKKEH